MNQRKKITKFAYNQKYESEKNKKISLFIFGYLKNSLIWLLKILKENHMILAVFSFILDFWHIYIAKKKGVVPGSQNGL
jgi:hypothetical protein